MEALPKVALAAGGWRHTLAVDDQGRLWAAGWNKFGQCGVGSNEEVVVAPRQVQVRLRGGCLLPTGLRAVGCCGMPPLLLLLLLLPLLLLRPA